ncbi:monovalent cation/H(+) antiporter subunit G [Candidatus Leptofilum sp.]|uniref:monovalent cation/H(+) antiporter subunit G n=1 Tax=Candidatus Leptofilum sp. TaxID=3241576 RepID=UPI003B5C0CE8
METLTQIGIITAVFIGTAFSITGVLGYFRLPDVYTKLHASGKVGVFGVVLLLVATIIASLNNFSAGRGLILILLLLITGPVTSHAISSAAYRLGIRVEQAVRDDLAEKSN